VPLVAPQGAGGGVVIPALYATNFQQTNNAGIIRFFMRLMALWRDARPDEILYTCATSPFIRVKNR
jgi:hypothetical protein